MACTGAGSHSSLRISPLSILADYRLSLIPEIQLMALIDYINLNVRHYRKKVRDAVDVLSIQFLSARDYDQMHVPAWNNPRAEALHDTNSLLSRLLELNDDAVEEAEKILSGYFRLFGRDIKGEGGFPDWHKDYLSGQCYPLYPYPRYSITVNTGSDIIVPWEISRLQFIPCLIRAHRITNDPRYVQHFFKALSHWRNANPFLFGVNWMCGLDISIRAYNIALGLIYFQEEKGPLRDHALRLLWAHLRYLQERDLYLGKKTVNNHQLVAALLHYALLHLFEDATTRRWRAGAYAIIRHEVKRQFHTDGGNFESALLYHQFVLEAMFASLGMLTSSEALPCLSDEKLLPKEFAERLEKATEFTISYCRAWTQVPQIGDSSDGRIIFHRKYFTWTPDDASYIAEWRALTFPSGEIPAGNLNLARADIRAESGLGTFTCRSYSVIFCAMPVSSGAGGHNHLDKASFLLRLPETPVFVDSGTFCYTSDLKFRDQFRGGRAHNIMMIDRQDQAFLNGEGAFEEPRLGDVGIELVPGSEEEPIFCMRHDGYSRLPGLGETSRCVRCCPDGLQVRDCLAGTGQVSAELIFNLHPKLSAEVTDDRVHVRLNSKDICTIKPASGWTISIEKTWYSSSYNARQASVRIVFSATLTLPLDTITEISIPRYPS